MRVTIFALTLAAVSTCYAGDLPFLPAGHSTPHRRPASPRRPGALAAARKAEVISDVVHQSGRSRARSNTKISFVPGTGQGTSYSGMAMTVKGRIEGFEDGTGVAVGPGSLQLQFNAHAQAYYLLDCTVADATKMKVGGTDIPLQDGHLLAAFEPETSIALLAISGDEQFSLFECEVTLVAE